MNNKMNNDEFVWWLKGFIQTCPASQPSMSQWDLIISKLNSVKNASENVSLKAYSTDTGNYTYDITSPNNIIKNKSILHD